MDRNFVTPPKKGRHLLFQISSEVINTQEFSVDISYLEFYLNYNYGHFVTISITNFYEVQLSLNGL